MRSTQLTTTEPLTDLQAQEFSTLLSMPSGDARDSRLTTFVEGFDADGMEAVLHDIDGEDHTIIVARRDGELFWQWSTLEEEIEDAIEEDDVLHAALRLLFAEGTRVNGDDTNDDVGMFLCLEYHNDLEYSVPAIGASMETSSWACLSVVPDEEKGRPAFTHSVAFEKTFGVPEVVIVGCYAHYSQAMIRAIAACLQRCDLRISPEGGRVGGLLRDADVLMRPVPQDLVSELAGGAVTFAQSAPIRLLQVCLPDKDGRLPGDPACRPDDVARQDTAHFRA